MNLISISFSHSILEEIDSLRQNARNSARKLIVKKMLYPDQDKEGQALVKAQIQFESTASIVDIMGSLTAHVTAYGSIPDELKRLYRVCKTDEYVIYACGSKTAQSFRAAIVFTKNNGRIKAVFSIQNWTEKDGLVESQDVIKNLGKEIRASFISADPFVFITTG